MSNPVIKIDPQILGGTPCFADTRVPVKSLYDHLKLGYSIDEFLEAFPTVERMQVEQLLDELERELPALTGIFPAKSTPWLSLAESIISRLQLSKRMSTILSGVYGKDSMRKWLKCKIVKGMFSDEYTIIVRTLSGENVAVFVPKDSAQKDNERVKVRVSEESGHAVAVLPDANQSTVDVDVSELMPA